MKQPFLLIYVFGCLHRFGRRVEFRFIYYLISPQSNITPTLQRYIAFHHYLAIHCIHYSTPWIP